MRDFSYGFLKILSIDLYVCKTQKYIFMFLLDWGMLNLSTLALHVRDFMEPSSWGEGIKTVLPQAGELVICSDDFPTPEICGEVTHARFHTQQHGLSKETLSSHRDLVLRSESGESSLLSSQDMSWQE